MTPLVWLVTAAAALVGVMLAMLLLGAGLFLRGRPLRGSCGGDCGVRVCDGCVYDAPQPLCEAREERP